MEEAGTTLGLNVTMPFMQTVLDTGVAVVAPGELKQGEVGQEVT